ncbi:protease complex subunit PrcB family protein [Pseudothermotoga sp. U03pept]|uniref:protease complex subunit PrcB family protein n=1 Tax=Pseudothermotoga sp. U03pept TaxID=3447012 RepID=UPI003F03E16C
MRVLIFLLLFFGVSLLAGMIYYTPVEFVFPENLYQAVGTKSASFQYIVLSKSEQIVLILKGWLFSPIQVGDVEPFKVRIVGSGINYEVDLPAKKSGIYTYMMQHLFVLPKEITKILVNGFEIKLTALSYTVKTTHGDDSISLTLLNEDGKPTAVFKPGEKILVKISAGMRKTGGYKVVVDSVDILGRVLQIKAHLVSPSASTPVTQAITYPAVLVEINEAFEPGKYQVICTLFDNDDINLLAEFEVF